MERMPDQWEEQQFNEEEVGEDEDQEPPPSPLQNQLVPDNLNLYEMFREYSTTIFKGGAYPKVAEDWMRHINWISKVMRCTDEEKVLLGSFSLQGKALLWWETTER